VWVEVLLYGQLLAVVGLLRGLKSWPRRRKLLVGLLPLCVMLGGFSLLQTWQGQQTLLDLLPLSSRHEAFLIQAPGQRAQLALLPADLSYFEGRSVADYLRHRNITRLDAVVVLPGDALTEEGSNGFQAALRTIPARTVLLPAALAEGQSALAAQLRPYPKSGARLQVDGLRLEGRPPRLKLLSGDACLLTVEDHYHPNSTCGVQAMIENGVVRMFARTAELDAGRYYRLVARQHQLTIYAGEAP
jgi:hypothetical protein